jgi:hypothetical protein
MTEEEKSFLIKFELDNNYYEYPVSKGQEWLGAILVRQERELKTIRGIMVLFTIITILGFLLNLFF